MLKRKVFLVSGLLLAMMASQSAWAQQKVHPVGTLSGDGNYTPTGETTNWQAVGEGETPDDATFIETTTNPGVIEFSLTEDVITDPGVDTGHILKFRAQNATNNAKTVTISLYEGANLRGESAIEVPRNTNTWTLYDYTIPSATVSVYNDLSIRISGNGTSKAPVQISWVELEVPDPVNSEPFVTTNAVNPATDVTQNQATLGGNVSDDGGVPLNDPNGVGVYLHTAPGAEAGTRYPFATVPAPPYPKDFSGVVGSLSQGVTYYFKAYAENTIGERIATNEESFTTWDVPTLLATPTVDNVQLKSATLGGRVTDDGLTAVTECGVVWSDAPAPDRNDGNDFFAAAGSCATGVDFTVAAGSLTTGTTYYFRSYAINAVGTAHSAEDGSFVPSGPPQLNATVDLGSVTDTQALLGGNITDNGGSAITAVGIYWDTIGTDPRNDGTHVPMTVAEPSFEQLVTGLTPGATIYFLAYATNGAGTTDSTIIDFPTQAGAPTMDPAPTVANIVGDGANLGGTMISDGGGANLDCGVHLTTISGDYDSSPPQSFGTCLENDPFAVTVSGLTSGLTYYFRAYATSDAGSDYSNQGSFIPQAAPIVISTAPDLGLVTHNSAVLGGDVTSDEGSPVTARGIVWDTIAISADPTSQPTATFVPMGAGLGSFSQEVSLPSGETIFFEAYATNSAGTAYSNNGRFFDTLTEPTIQATNATITRFAGRSMRISWTRGNGDGSIVVIRETGTPSSGPPVDGDDYVGNPDFSQTTPPPQLNPGGNGNFVVHKGPENSVWVTRLNLNTSYSIAIYEYAGASPDYVQSTPAEVTQPTSTLAVHNEDLRVNCDDCHNHGSFNARDAELSAICETCHNPDGTNEARFKTEFANHRPPTDNLDIDFVDCGMCHEVHNFNANDTTESYHSVDEVPVINKSFLRANVDKYVSTATPPAYLPDTDQPYRAGPPEILADTPDRAVEGGVEAVEPSTPTQARGYCQVCHTLTKYHRSTNLTGGLGSNQAHDGINNNSGQGTEVNCGECHEHNNNFSGVGGSQTCIECHQSGQPPRPIITTQFDLLSSHMPNGSGVVTQPDCEVCHDQTGHYGDQIVGVVDADTGAIYNQPDAGPSNTTEPLQGEAFEPHCLSCHADGVASRLPDDDGGVTPQTKTSPFTNSPAPPIIGQVDLPPPLVGVVNTWDEPTAAHNRGTPIMSCVGGCHGSGHGSAELSLLAPITSESGVVDDASVFCMECHKSSGYSSLDVRSDFDPAIAGTGYRTQRGSGGALVNQRHDVFVADQEYSGGAAPDTVTSLSCADCHSPHDDSSEFPVAVNPETGVWLGTYNEGGYLASGADPTFGAGATEPDYIEFCNACHDGAGGTPQGGTSVLSPNLLQIGGAGGAYEANFHGYGFGGARGNGFLKPPFQIDTEYAPLQCTTCHGAHGGDNIYNLRSSITVGGNPMSTGGWVGDTIGDRVVTTYDMKLANVGEATQADLQWGAWCSFCHNMEKHGVDEKTTCNTGHVHGSTKF